MSAFTVDIGFKKVPLMGNLAEINDGIFIPRSGTDKQREKIMKIITDR